MTIKWKNWKLSSLDENLKFWAEKSTDQTRVTTPINQVVNMKNRSVSSLEIAENPSSRAKPEGQRANKHTRLQQSAVVVKASPAKTFATLFPSDPPLCTNASVGGFAGEKQLRREGVSCTTCGTHASRPLMRLWERAREFWGQCYAGRNRYFGLFIICGQSAGWCLELFAFLFTTSRRLVFFFLHSFLANVTRAILTRAMVNKNVFLCNQS